MGQALAEMEPGDHTKYDRSQQGKARSDDGAGEERPVDEGPGETVQCQEG